MSAKRIVITEFMDLNAVESLRGDFDVLYDPTLGDDPERLFDVLGDADGVIVRTATQVNQAFLDAGPKMQCIGRLGVGLDNFDLDACASMGVPVYPAIGANALSVAEYVLTTASALLRGAYYRHDQMLAGQWPRKEAQGVELSGRTLGIVGLGSIGRITAELMQNVGMRIIANDPYVEASDPAWDGIERCARIEDLLSASDVVSLHVPLTDETRDLIAAKELGAMRAEAVLINAARGGVVNETALADALKTGQIAGAAVDVFVNEPLSAEDAAIFQGAPNLILTPHIAGVTGDANARVSAMTAQNVRRVLEG